MDAPLRILVVGAGVAGLTLAARLCGSRPPRPSRRLAR